MNRAAKNVLRRLGTDIDLDLEREELTAREREAIQQREIETESQRLAQRNREAGLSSVPEEMRSHIFDPFVTTKPGGTGLGLALVAKLVGDHGGIIDLECGKQWTEFRVMLPMMTAYDG